MTTQSAAITFCTVIAFVFPRKVTLQGSSCMHIKHTLHCQLHAYQTHAKLSAACKLNTCKIVSCMHTKHMHHCQLHAYQTHASLSAACIPNTCIIVSCMHTKHMQHCQLHACRKKFLIEILEGTKVISRKKGFTTTTCVSGVAIGQQTKQFDNLPESAKVLFRPQVMRTKLARTTQPE